VTERTSTRRAESGCRLALMHADERMLRAGGYTTVGYIAQRPWRSEWLLTCNRVNQIGVAWHLSIA
jgi:hypothetical protein